MTRTVRVRRCTGRNKYGGQCGNYLRWEEPEEEIGTGDNHPAPLCYAHRDHVHVRVRRCTGRNQYGEPCRNTLRWEEPEAGSGADDDLPAPLCYAHRDHVPDGARRCTAVTASGERCRRQALTRTLPAREEERALAIERQLCNLHAALALPAGSDRRRCTGRNRDGTRCRNRVRWEARAESADDGREEVPLCHAHRGEAGVPKGDARRCRAMTTDGRRCRHWATRASQCAGKPRCGMHAGVPHLPGEDDVRRCTALTNSGRRCRQWAMRDTDPPLCRIHKEGPYLRSPDVADIEAGRVCSATTLAGRRCRLWAMKHSSYCRIHHPQGPPGLRHGYFRRKTELSEAEQATVARLAEEGKPLAAEIALLRLKIRALLAYLSRPELPMERRLAAYRLLLLAVRTVGRLFKAQQALEAAASGKPPYQMPSLAQEGLQESTGGGMAMFLTLLSEDDGGDSPPQDEEE